MIDSFEYEGYWFLPDRVDDNIPGRLSFDPKQGAVLELRGVFKGLSPFEELRGSGHVAIGGETEKLSLILGVVSGKLITLKDCTGTWSGFSSPGFEQSTFHVGIVYEGIHFTQPRVVKFKKIVVHYSYLDEWTRVFGGAITLPNNLGDGEMVIRYKRPDPITIIKNKKMRISIGFSFSVSGLTWFVKEMGVKQKAHLSIEMEKEKPFEAYGRLIYDIQNFISLAVTKSVYPVLVEGYTDYNVKESNGKRYNPPVTIIYRAVGEPSKPGELSPIEPLFVRAHTAERIGLFIRNWLKKSKVLSPVYNLYFAVRYKPETYSELQFLSLARALEVYHARVTSDQRISFKKRLMELLSPHELDEFLERLIGGKEEFAELVKNTRNYLTHYNVKIKKKAAQGRDFILMLRQMRAIIEIYLLREIGFKLTEAVQLVKDSQNYGSCIFIQNSIRMEKEKQILLENNN